MRRSGKEMRRSVRLSMSALRLRLRARQTPIIGSMGGEGSLGLRRGLCSFCLSCKGSVLRHAVRWMSRSGLRCSNTGSMLRCVFTLDSRVSKTFRMNILATKIRRTVAPEKSPTCQAPGKNCGYTNLKITLIEELPRDDDDCLLYST